MRKTAMELKQMANEYEKTDPALGAVIVALASARMFDNYTGERLAESNLLAHCLENSEKISRSIDILIGLQDDHKADLN